ncbi:SLBB domain-containing protein [Siccirubricoccus deserti]
MQVTIAAQASRRRFAHIRSAGFPDFGRAPCPQIFLDYPTLLPFLLDQAVLLTGEVRLPGLFPVVDGAGLDAVLAAAGGATDTADLSTVESPASRPTRAAPCRCRAPCSTCGRGTSPPSASPRATWCGCRAASATATWGR